MCVFVYAIDDVTEPAVNRVPLQFREGSRRYVEPDDFRRNDRGELGTRTATLDRDGIMKLREEIGMQRPQARHLARKERRNC